MAANRKPQPFRNTNFPGSFTAQIVLVIFALTWPWVTLHGAARIGWGIAWTLFLLLVGALALAAITGGRDIKPTTPPKSRRPPAAAGKVRQP